MARMSRDDVTRGTTSAVKTLNAVPTMTRMPRTSAARRRAVSTPSSCHAAPRGHRGGVRSPRGRVGEDRWGRFRSRVDRYRGTHGCSRNSWWPTRRRGSTGCADTTGNRLESGSSWPRRARWIRRRSRTTRHSTRRSVLDGSTVRPDVRDSTTFRRRFTPRKARSPWSQRNTVIAERLTAAGRMQPAGEAEIARAKGDGRWDAAYAGQSSIEVPDDLAIALAAQPRALAMFEILTSQNRYAVLYRIGQRQESGDPSEAYRAVRGHAGSGGNGLSAGSFPRRLRPESRSRALPGATGLNGDS